jgi:uncharacterized membrane protein
VARLQELWGRLGESLWFLPSVLVIGAILLGVGMVELSTLVDAKALARWPRVFGAGPDGSRSMLAAIAGSMITVAGVTFSITIVAVTQASTQYSPRILRNFMRDRANQAVLGTFVGIFAYCLVVLRTIREGPASTEFVPSLAVLVGVLLAIVGVAVLIFFVHHIATTLQASEIVSRITWDTRKVVDQLFPDRLSHDRLEVEPAYVGEAVSTDAWRPVPAPRTGYIQHYSRSALVRIATQYDLLVRVEQPIGEFVVEGRPLAWFAPHPLGAGGMPETVWRPDDVARSVVKTWIIGTNRSLDLDPGFGFRQLVDVALKALSPGVNDSTTALTCIDHLGALLIRLADRRIETAERDESGRLCVITGEPGFQELLGLAIDEIRQHARGNVAVLERLMVMLGGVAAVAHESGRRRAVVQQLELLQATAAETVSLGHDLAQLDGVAHRVLAAVHAPTTPPDEVVSSSAP